MVVYVQYLTSLIGQVWADTVPGSGAPKHSRTRWKSELERLGWGYLVVHIALFLWFAIMTAGHHPKVAGIGLG